jgi:hypothetical protein
MRGLTMSVSRKSQQGRSGHETQSRSQNQGKNPSTEPASNRQTPTGQPAGKARRFVLSPSHLHHVIQGKQQNSAKQKVKAGNRIQSRKQQLFR